MHPDQLRIAAYLDGALDDQERAELRGHILTCPACAARLENLRADARRISVALARSPTPDVRASVRARLRRPARDAWLGQGLALAGALAALLLFALLVGGRGAITAGRTPDRLVIADRSNSQLVALDAGSGTRLATLKLDQLPLVITYDQARDRLYVLLTQSVLAVDPHTFKPAGDWQAPEPFAAGAGMALDERGGRLYISQPGGVAELSLDAPDMAVERTIDLAQAPGALALSPDGTALFALNADQGRLWTITTRTGGARSQTLAPERSRSGYLSASRDGRYVYVLLTSVGERGDQPGLWRIDRDGQAPAPTLLAPTPTPWDLELLDSGQLAIPRGDGRTGGVELMATDTLSTTVRLDPGYDQHHVVAGPDGALYGLNFTHATITRFDAATRAVAWRTPEDRGLVPWEGVYVRGGWRWPVLGG
jgi:DNA-binding beta-propeller fold protein YncE